MDRIAEIQARLAAINTELDTATGDALANLETEAQSLTEELQTLQGEAQRKQQLRSQIAAGGGVPIPGMNPAQPTEEQRTADEFARTRRMNINAEQARATLISSGTLVTPTKIDGINEIPGAKVSSIIDLVKVVNCVGMGSYRVAYVDADADAAANQTEGQAAAAGTLGTYKYVDIKPESVAVIDYISKQAKKQTPLQYAAKVRSQALLALRKKAAKIVSDALVNSKLNATLQIATIGADTLRKIVLSHGDDESVLAGGNYLFLTKADLIAFGDVRGTNEKKALYTITPDGANPNIGTISEGGVSVRYCINSNLSGLTGSTAAKPGMFYGNPYALELGLFSDYEIQVSKDFAIDKLMDTIVGDVELGSDVTTKHGFTAVHAAA